MGKKMIFYPSLNSQIFLFLVQRLSMAGIIAYNTTEGIHILLCTTILYTYRVQLVATSPGVVANHWIPGYWVKEYKGKFPDWDSNVTRK